MIHPARIKRLNRNSPAKGDYVLYWMQQSQRADWNHALEYAAERADEAGLPLVVFFGLTDGYPGANLRHYRFMIEGLAKTRRELESRNIQMVVRRVAPAEGALGMAARASVAVTDVGYAKPGRAWKAEVARRIACPLISVESDVVVPVKAASDKSEYAAFTLRRKVHRRLDEFLAPLKKRNLKNSSLSLDFDDALSLDNPDEVLRIMDIDRSVAAAPGFVGGNDEAQKRLNDFINNKLHRYHEDRNDPNLRGTSDLSPYLHFGQISPLQIALKITGREGPGPAAFLEEFIVRRELAANFAYFEKHHDSIRCLPDWARKTLAEHEKDPREIIYTKRALENAQTHDPYWNAAQSEMVKTGKMHGYMRMYWGKKILEWSKTPAQAYKTALDLNDKYELDGRDPNGCAGVAWCFGKHDRPWARRAIFGTVRYMNAQGLKRKFDADAYTRYVAGL